MKIYVVAALAALRSLTLVAGESHSDEAECTHGKLYVVDDSTSNIHVIDVSEGVLQDLTVETTLSLPSVGAGQLAFYGSPGDPLVVQYRGKEEQAFLDSFVRVIDAGFSFESPGDNGHISYTAPSIAENAIIDDCARPIHQVRHDDKIAIFCDGSYNITLNPQVNTTVQVIDERKLGSSTESAIVHSVVLEGTHHGVAIPVDDGHLLHSLALQDRIDRVPGTPSLPVTFQVVDYEGTVLHELSDVTDPDTHCSGFHGSATLDNTFLLACDDVHGGVVRVVYDAVNGGYTSRAIAYPPSTKYESFRVGSFAYHKNSDQVVGSFTLSGGTEFHLVAISPDTTALEESNILTLPGNVRQCGYQFEVGMGEHLLVFMPNGVLHVFEVDNGTFTAVAQKQIVPNMSACSQAAFVGGIGQAFVATPADNKMYAVDLSHVEHGEMDVYESTLPFTPSGMTVSGFSYDHACKYDDEHSSGASVVSLAGGLVVTGLLFFL
eukprot:scaffold7213_cov166-Amphora_coffeaeformis.AAC.8